jgi:hypothetical protein
MGSLDDAIREHLELKRRLGASDDEIQEKERQAFGKGRPPAPPPEEAAAEPAEPQFVDEPDIDLAAADPAPNGRSSAEIFEPDEVPPEESLDPGLTVRDERASRQVEPEPAAEPEAEPEAAIDWHGDSEPAPKDDVLEETPEFLEETPEHDRLWFEQRPPKDFDFD